MFCDYKRELNFSVVPWRNGEDADLVFQWSAVQASAQEIFHSNSRYLTLPLLLTELSLLFNHGP